MLAPVPHHPCYDIAVCFAISFPLSYPLPPFFCLLQLHFAHHNLLAADPTPHTNTLLQAYVYPSYSSIAQSQSPPPPSHTLFSCPIFYTAALDVVVFTWFHESVYPWHTLSLSLPRFLMTACCDVRV